MSNKKRQAKDRIFSCRAFFYAVKARELTALSQLPGAPMSFYTVMQLLGGVGIFLFAIKLISDSLQSLAGEKLRGIIGMFTKTPVLGVILGGLATMVIQSSCATTVMTVSFVDAGLMNLSQAIGVIMGANIGTTVTGQILAFNIKDLAYLFIIIGVLLFFIGKSNKTKQLGSGMLGFGLLFVGMQTMEQSMSFLQGKKELFLAFSGNPLMGLAAGALLTLLVQSSSATVGLTMALGMQGLLPLEAAIPIIFGDNIGTTITSVLASLSTGRSARQACAAHVLFNVIGVCIWMPLMPLWIGFIEGTSSSIAHQIANAHTLFNVCNTVLFLPFVRPFAMLIRKILPDADPGESKEVLYLDPLLLERTPVVAVSAVRYECRHMGEIVKNLLARSANLFFDGKEDEKEHILKLEDSLDNLDTAIREYAGKIMSTGLSGNNARELEACVICAGDLERIGDKGKRMLDFYEYSKKRGSSFSAEAKAELSTLYANAQSVLVMALDSFEKKGLSDANWKNLASLSEEIRRTENTLRESHAIRLAHGKCSPEAGLVFIDVLGAIEQVSYRARKIADHMLEAPRNGI